MRLLVKSQWDMVRLNSAFFSDAERSIIDAGVPQAESPPEPGPLQRSDSGTQVICPICYCESDESERDEREH